MTLRESRHQLKRRSRTQRTPGIVTFQRLKYLSFAHSIIYLLLLWCWLTSGPPTLRFILGMSHGLGWIAMSLLCIWAVKRRIISSPLAVTVAVIGGLGPFAGSAGFLIEERRQGQPRENRVGV